MQSTPVEHLSNTTPHCHAPYPPDSQAAAEEERARKKKAEEDQAKEKVQALLALEDTQYKDTHRKMRCGHELFHVRSPHRISADVNVLTSAHHTGYADVDTAIFVGFQISIQRKKWICGSFYSETLDWWTLIQRKIRFVDLKTDKISNVFKLPPHRIAADHNI